MNNILILRGPVRSGKTTMLWNKFANGERVGGFLTPDDENGIRRFYDLATKTFLPFELPLGSNLPAVEVGRFRFSKSTFERGREILSRTIDCDLFIVDEAGRLEVEKSSGWEPALTHLIEDYKRCRRQGKLLLVVRDSLVKKAVEKWGLEKVIVTETLDRIKN